MEELFIGIDFGTTKSLVSYYSKAERKAVLIRLGRGRDDIPTSVYATEAGNFYFGEDADDLMEEEPARYCRTFKMKLGSSVPALSFWDGRHMIQYSAKELTKHFLRYLKDRCEKEVFMGKEMITGAVITKPVLFSPAQYRELREAAYNAGFQKVEFVTEPEAAGHAFCTFCPTDAFKRNALVVDWGDGTLDMSLVSRAGNCVQTYRKYTDGMLKGGKEFDQMLWEYVCGRIQKQDGIDLNQEDPIHQSRFFGKVCKAKEMLSTQMQYTLRLSCSQGACSPVSLERSEFENLIRRYVEEAGDKAKDLVNKIGNAMKPEILLLVGGSSQIPLITSVLEQSTGLPCKPWHLSQVAVCLGAGLLAGRETKKKHRIGTDDPQSLLLMEKAKTGDLAGLTALINEGANVYAQNKDGWTALMEAACRGHLECVRALLKAKANVNTQEFNGGATALMEAAYAGHTDVVIDLIECGADVNEQKKDGWTALMLASEKGHTKVVEELLKGGGRVNEQNNYGETALMWAAKEGHTKCVKTLIKAESEINAQNKDGWTALMEAACRGHLECVRALLKAKANVNTQEFNGGATALMEAAYAGHTDVVIDLIERGADVNEQKKDGWTALMLASEKGHTKVVEELLKRGGRVNEQNNYGETALMWATKKGHVDIVALLKSSGESS